MTSLKQGEREKVIFWHNVCHPLAISTVFSFHRILWSISMKSISNIKSPCFDTYPHTKSYPTVTSMGVVPQNLSLQLISILRFLRFVERSVQFSKWNTNFYWPNWPSLNEYLGYNFSHLNSAGLGAQY